MKNKIFYPDYNHSILGIPNTLLHHYGVSTDVPNLPQLERALRKKYKNIIFIILDGMGIDMLQHTLSARSFLRSHVKTKISSVFPATTVAATTTFYTGLSPVEHGWLGWSPYFKDLDHVVEIFTNKDFYTGKLLSEKVAQKIPYVHIFDKIRSVNKDVCLTEIFPFFIKPDGVENFDQLCQRIKQQTSKKEEQFILAYWPEPDSTSHKFGPYSENVKKVLKDLNTKLKRLCAQLKDSLIIVSADHGHTENEDIFLNDYPDLMDCLALPLALDMRAQSVFLKPDKEKTFMRLFEKYLSKDFILVKSSDALSTHLFGYGEPHPYTKDFLGDYLIIAKTEKSLVQRFPDDVYHHLSGSHSGLTQKEMVVPLILVEK